MIYGWMWIGVIVLAILVEAFTEQLISIWFVPAAIIAVILDFCSVDILWQVLAFLLLSAAGILFAKIFLPKISPSDTYKSNLDSIIGEKCVVTETIDNFAGCGQIKIKGQVWSARGVSDDDVFEVGEVLNIVAIEGVKVICKK